MYSMNSGDFLMKPPLFLLYNPGLFFGIPYQMIEPGILGIRQAECCPNTLLIHTLFIVSSLIISIQSMLKIIHSEANAKRYR